MVRSSWNARCPFSLLASLRLQVKVLEAEARVLVATRPAAATLDGVAAVAVLVEAASDVGDAL
jgi:hypothetical protein